MASVDWNCKGHGGTEAKAFIRHNDKEQRLKNNHSNKDVNKSYTDRNIDFMNMSYAEKCKMYDDRVSELAQNSRMTKATTTYIGLEIPIPDAIGNDKDKERFAKRCVDTIGDMLGKKNIISADLHRDERHVYKDSAKGIKRMSLDHVHVGCVPGIKEDGVERLCCKKFSSRANIMKLNSLIQDMALKEFGISFHTGEGTKSYDSVEALKLQSERAELNELSASLSRRKQNLEEKETKLNTRETNIINRENNQNTLLHQEYLRGYKQGIEDEKKRQKQVIKAMQKGTEIEQSEQSKKFTGEVARYMDM